MACTIKNTGVAEQRDVFKDIMAKAEVKKAVGVLNGVLDGSISVNDLMAQQKATGKKNLITKTEVGKDTDTVPIYEHVEIKQVQAMNTGNNFYFRLQPNQYESTIEDEIEVVITKKTYKKIKVTYTIEDTSQRKDLQGSTEELQKFASAFKGIQSGDTSTATKLLEDKFAEYKDNFDGVYDGVSSIIDKIRKDANIPSPPSDAVVIVDKIKKHTGSNSITLDKPKSITRVSARKANTNFFFNVVQYKFIKESGIVLCDNLYEEYKVEYKGEGEATSKAAALGALTGDFPTAGDVVNDINSALASAGNVVGNIGREITQAAGQFGKDITGLIGSANSGDLINQALAAAQSAPAIFTTEANVRDKATNAIPLPDLAGGEAGVLEVMTKKEGDNFFSKMFKGEKSGWRLNGTDLFLFEVRAEVKVKYTKEIEPPADSSVPPTDLTNGPPLNPCLDLPSIGVKVGKIFKLDKETGKKFEELIKYKEPKPQPKKLPTTKAEPPPTLAETATVADSTEAPSSAISALSITPAEALSIIAEIRSFERTNSIDYWQKKTDDYVANSKRLNKDPTFLAFKKKKDASGFKTFAKYIASGAPEITQQELDVREELILNYAGWKSVKGQYTAWKALLVASQWEINGKMSTEEYEQWVEDFRNYEGKVGGASGAVFVRKLTTEKDMQQYQAIRNYHLSRKEDIIAVRPFLHPNG